MSSSRTLSRKRRTSFTCIKPRFGPSIILLYIAASVEQYCDITQVNALPENEGILERRKVIYQGQLPHTVIECNWRALGDANQAKKALYKCLANKPPVSREEQL